MHQDMGTPKIHHNKEQWVALVGALLPLLWCFELVYYQNTYFSGKKKLDIQGTK